VPGVGAPLGVGLGPAAVALPSPADIFVRNFFTAGPSSVDDADLTYSPMSPRSFTTSLLSSPNSLASS
jgi:hypothetical protein